MNTERPEDRWHNRRGWPGAGPFAHSGASGILIGAVIVLIGLLLLLDNMGIVQIHDAWRFWPLFLIVIGASKALENRSPASVVWGGLIALVGTALLLDNLHIVVFDFDIGNLIWPLLVIGFGVTLLIKAMERKRYVDAIPSSAAGLAGSTAPSAVTDSNLGAWAVFSSVKRRIDAQDFKGGEVAAVFGEVKIDLRKAGIAGERAVIDVNALFGGVDIRVPETWSVVIKGTGVFGAFEDKTVSPRSDPGVKPPQLIITGTAVFGAAKVDN